MSGEKFLQPCFRISLRAPISGQMMTTKHSKSVVVPLTRIDRKTGQPYVRPKGVREEIEAVLELPLHKAFDLACAGHLRPQTLVYAPFPPAGVCDACWTGFGLVIIALTGNPPHAGRSDSPFPLKPPSLLRT
jgi:hypothetical protein